MPVVLVEGVTDRIALEAVAVKLGLDFAAAGIEIVPIGGAQAVGRAYARHDGQQVVGLCDAREQGWFRRVLGSATYVCTADLEDELIRALGPARVEAVIAAQGELDSFRNFQNQPAWRGRPVDAQLHRWLRAAHQRNKRYPPLLVEALDRVQMPAPLAGVLMVVA
jgi:Overcoming lysogenization defect protein-like, TOPRIM domain